MAMAPKLIRTQKESGEKLKGRSIEIVVGDEQEVFSVHEALVRSSSVFFDKAMAGSWKESTQRLVHLPKHDPKIFALYIHWLYCDTMPVFCDEPGPPANLEYLQLVMAYVLGDKLLDIAFQNAAIDAIIEKSLSKASDGARWFPVGEVVEYAYDNTTDSAPIRELRICTLRTGGPFLLRLASKLLDKEEFDDESFTPSTYHS
ncbi:hypothetical protein BJX99DRAFT_268968 [Aspergillus californicus]